jgi:transcriptional regulator with XRE-family HTH domain
MSTLQERFRLLRGLKPEISNADLARATGAKPPSVGDWFNGNTKSLKAETAAKVAGVYGVSHLWLAADEGEMFDGAVTVPVGTAKITRTTPLSPEVEKKMERLLLTVYNITPERRLEALTAALEVLIDHLPQIPSA